LKTKVSLQSDIRQVMQVAFIRFSH